MKKNEFNLIFALLCFGYMIDYYDLSIFAVARVSILTDLHVPPSELMPVSKLLFNAQTLGIFIGGILSGIWGDKIGRVSSIRVGIFLYSTAIIANIFVTSIAFFAVCRFIAGMGLAGELAASIVVLNEMSKQENRSTVAGIVYFFGILGGILSTAIQSFFNWKILFLIGGVAGFILLLLRKKLVDSSLFLSVKHSPLILRGSLKQLLSSRHSLFKIIKLAVCFIPFWLTVFFVNFSPEIARGIGIKEKIHIPYCLFIYFVGSIIGLILFSYLSRTLKSHKKIICMCFILVFFSIFLLCFIGNQSAAIFSNLFLIFGLSSGYLGIYMTMLAENFGTNQRSTGTTLTSNIGRSTFILINYLVPFTIYVTKSTVVGSLLSVGVIILMCIICLFFTRETQDISMDYIE